MDIHLSKIVRTIRKVHKINQKDFANIIDISQGSVSKVESGQLELNLKPFLKLLQYFQIDLEALHSGYLEMDLLIDIEKTKYKLPAIYRESMKYSARHIAMMTKSADLNNEEFGTIMKELGVDPDIFTILNTPVSEQLLNDFAQKISGKGFNKIFNLCDILGNDIDYIGRTPGTIKYVSRFIKKSSDYLDINVSVDHLGTKNIDFEIEAPNPVVLACANLAFQSIKGDLKFEVKPIDDRTSLITYCA